MTKDARNALARLYSGWAGDRSGTTAIEYALIAAGIAVTILAAVGGAGSAITTKFDGVSTDVTNFMSK